MMTQEIAKATESKTHTEIYHIYKTISELSFYTLQTNRILDFRTKVFHAMDPPVHRLQSTIYQALLAGTHP